jgi:thiol-disulfide isomerase/thioredoxin
VLNVLNRSVAALAVSVLLLASVPVPTAGSGGDFFYIFGASTCPYCRALDQFFTQSYPGKSYFCKVDLDTKCSQNFNTVVSLLATKGVPREELGYVPMTLIVRDWKYVLAVVIGAVTNTKFWDNITSRVPQEKTLVYIPEQSALKAYEVTMSFDEQQNIVSRYLVLPQGSSSPFSEYVLIPILLIGAGVAVIAYALLGRRR